MIIYIVLGIAADDIFVFYDAYQQSAEMDRKVMDTIEKRLALLLDHVLVSEAWGD